MVAIAADLKEARLWSGVRGHYLQRFPGEKVPPADETGKMA